jgi:CRISPR/Cas system-associated protein Cas7 (RAMP superfamily)
METFETKLIFEPNPIYEIGLSILAEYQAHALSNIGSNKSNRMNPRKQVLSIGINTGAISPGIIRHFHSDLTANYLAESKVYLCAGCLSGDSRRFAAVVEDERFSSIIHANKDFLANISLESIIKCGQCDCCGVLLLSQNPDESNENIRSGIAKDSVYTFTFGLGVPTKQFETSQIFTRMGNLSSRMIYKIAVQSGFYAYGIRGCCYSIGADTRTRRLIIHDDEERQKRHVALLKATRDTVTSLKGAMMAKLSPQLTSLRGVITVTHTVGSAVIPSGLLDQQFIERALRMKEKNLSVYPFDSIDSFRILMNSIIENSVPAKPAGQ